MPSVISVFCGAQCREGDAEYQLGLELGTALAQAGFEVATGGYGGVMEAISRGASQAGGRVIGVVASSVSQRPNAWITQTIIVPKWEDRLFRLISVGDGYVACPGGTGTLVELAVAWEMMHKRVMPPKPLVALGEFWKPVVAHIEAAHPTSRGLVRLADSVETAVAVLRENGAPAQLRQSGLH